MAGTSKEVFVHRSSSEEVEGRKIRALVVDDDNLSRRVHGALLKKFGVEIDAAENGKKSIDLFASGKYYDLVLMDMEMPIMDGSNATKELRRMGVKSMIVGVTSCNLKAEKQAFIGSGLDFCLKKPLTKEGVITILDELDKKLP